MSAIITVKIIYSGFLASCASGVALILWISRVLSLLRSPIVFLYKFLFGFRFSIRYRVSIKFRFRFFKYALYSRVLVLLVFLYSKLKLLLSIGRYSA